MSFRAIGGPRSRKEGDVETSRQPNPLHRLVVLQDEKAHLLNAITEAEQQLLLWEKKIQLAKV